MYDLISTASRFSWGSLSLKSLRKLDFMPKVGTYLVAEIREDFGHRVSVDIVCGNFDL